MRSATRAIRQGQRPDPTTGAVIVPIYQSANFVFKGVGQPNAFEYSRTSKPLPAAKH
ncbi:MAG: PLP-dependent transferase [Planctomycetaceae bacterium]|nr:PLP-dependent transferase [Planctomycetaceae bacterium]